MSLLPCHNSLSQRQGRTVLVALQNHLLLFLDGALKQQIAASCSVSGVPRSACVLPLRLVQLLKCPSKEAVAYKCARQCEMVYLGFCRYATSRCIATGTAGVTERQASPTLCPLPS